jgi:hypothetical protein
METYFDFTDDEEDFDGEDFTEDFLDLELDLFFF